MQRALPKIAIALTLLASSCVRTETTPVAYIIPLEANSHGADAARTCAAACRTANPTSESGFFACIGTCPDAQVMRGAECAPPPESSPPEELCYTRLVETEVPDPAVAEALLDLIGQIAEAGAHAAASEHGGSRHESGRHESRRHESEHSESHTARRVAATPRRGR